MSLQLQKMTSLHLVTIHQSLLHVSVMSWMNSPCPCALLCSSRYTPAQVYDQVIDSVKAELNASELDPGDAAMIAMKVQDTIETTLKYLQIGHKMDMLVMYTITHAVINRSQEERMDQDYARQLLQWKQGCTWVTTRNSQR